MREDSPAPIGAPDGDWLAQAPAEGEWLIAIAIPRDSDVPQEVLEAADALTDALGLPRTVYPEGCAKNICGKNYICSYRKS